MSTAWQYHIPLAIVAAAVAAYFMLRAWTFGVARPIASVVALGGGIYAGYQTFLHANTILEALSFKPEQITTLGFSILAGLVVFLILRKIGHSLANRMFSPESVLGKFVAGPIGAVLSLIPALLVVAALSLGLRAESAIKELKHIQSASKAYALGSSNPLPTPPIVRMRDALEGIPGASEFLDQFDLIGPPAPRNLAALVLLSGNFELYKKLNRSAAGEIYRHPRVKPLLEDRDLQRLIRNRMFLRLLRHEEILRVAELPALKNQLSSLDLTTLLEQILES